LGAAASAITWTASGVRLDPVARGLKTDIAVDCTPKGRVEWQRLDSASRSMAVPFDFDDLGGDKLGRLLLVVCRRFATSRPSIGFSSPDL